jgi:hypothetical protein
VPMGRKRNMGRRSDFGAQSAGMITCRFRKSYPDILMMQPG